MHAAPRPCSTCPYRRDTPPGIWAPEEYAKLPPYDDNLAWGTFLCHLTTSTGVETVCRGWLAVHAESVAARLAVLRGELTNEQRYAPVDVPLYSSGAEACEAGMAGVPEPDEAAKAAVARLLRRGVGR